MKLTFRRLFDALRAWLQVRPRSAVVPCEARHGGTGVAIGSMRRRRNRGTSLMDVLVGIVIGIVLIGIAVPTIPALMDPYRLSFAARVVASELSAARMKAIAENRRHRINFNVSTHTYQMQVETATNTWSPVGGMHELPTGCTFGTIASPPTFDTRGMLNQDYDITVSSASQTKHVAVNVLGKVAISAS